MKCGSCGFENSDGAKLCEKCGRELCPDTEKDKNSENENLNDKNNTTPEESTDLKCRSKLKFPFSLRPSKEKGKGQAKESFAAAIIPICAVLLIVLTLFLIISFIVETTEVVEIEDYYMALYDDELDVTYFLFKGKLVPGFAYGKCEDPYTEGGVSDDGSVVVVRCPRKDKTGSYTLSAVTPSGVRMISDSVDGKISRFFVSADGGYVAYSLTSPGALYIYDVKTNKSEIAVSKDVDRFSFTDECKKIVYLTSERALCVLEISADKINPLCENTVEYAVLDDGERIVYVSEARKLFVYTSWSNSTEEVAENVADMCASVNESTFAYTVMQDGSETDENGVTIIAKSYFRKGQKDIEIGTNINVAAFNEDGSYIYVSDRRDGDLYLICEEENTLIFEGKREYTFSKDITEVCYTDDDGTYIYTRKAGHVKISESKSLSRILGADEEAEHFSNAFYTESAELDGKKKLSVIYVSPSVEVIRVAEEIQSLDISKNGSTLFIEKDEKIYTAKKNASEPAELCEGKLEAGMYYLSDDKEALYIKEANLDDTFSLYWCMEGDKRLISDRVCGESYMSHDGYLFFTEIPAPNDASDSSSADSQTSSSEKDSPNEEFDASSGKGFPLYCVKNGEEKSHVTDNVCMIRTTKSSAYIITPAEGYKEGERPVYSVYGCVKGNKFKLILNEITIFDEVPEENE